MKQTPVEFDFEDSSVPHVIWILPGMLTLMVLGIWMGTHDGLSPDFSQYPLDQAAALQSLPGARFSGVLYQVFKHLPLLLVIFSAMLGYGLLLSRILFGKLRISLPLAIGLGLAVLSLINWIMGALGVLNLVSAWGLIGVGIILAIVLFFLRQRENASSSGGMPMSSSAWLIACPMIGLALVACCCPPGTLWKVEAYGYDVTSYHLQLPKEWMAMGQLRGLNHNVYSYFPSLTEGLYLLCGNMLGSVYRSIYLCQMLHFSMLILAAVQLAQLAGKWLKPFSANLTGAALIAIPWSLIVGSMAYNEMTVMAMGTTALLLLFDENLKAKMAVILAGVCGGVATFAKLTAGPMLVLPLTVMVLCKANAQRDRQSWHMVLLLFAAGLTLSPYFIRNTIQAGNPVFPFAANSLGDGHWEQTDVDRWNKGHQNDKPVGERLKALGWQWLGNQGYAAMGGKQRMRLPGAIESQNIARFDYEWGLSPWWVLAIIGGISLFFDRKYRKLATVLFVFLIVQLFFWLLATHLQARFLIWTLLPGCLMLGVGFGRFENSVITQRIYRVAFASLILLSTSISLNVMLSQTTSRMPVWQFADSLIPEEDLDHIELGQAMAGDHIVNHLPARSKVYFVADASRMLYVRINNIYHSAFDPSLLGDLIRKSNGNMTEVREQLKAQGVTHLYVHWSELARLHATYGYDADVTDTSLAKLTQDWPIAFEMQQVITIYTLP